MHRKFRLLTLEEQEALRREALQAVMKGENKSRVAERLGVTRQAVHQWVRRYRAGGPASLEAKPRGRRKIRPLLPWQEELVTGAILRRPPGGPGLQGAAWTKRAIADFVEENFGVRLPEWIVSAYLRDWGFSSQREVRRAFADPSALTAARQGEAPRTPVAAASFGPRPGSVSAA
jgi:transposase